MRAPATTPGRAASSSGALDELLERLVGLRADHAAVADHGGGNARHAVAARLFPVGLDCILVGALFDHLSGLTRVQSDRFCNGNQGVGVADVLAVDEIGAK